MGAAACMTKHAGISSGHTQPIEPGVMSQHLGFCLYKPPCVSLLLSPGSFTSSTSADTGTTAGAADSVDQVSPTMPRSTKNRVSGKLRRSASAISKSSNWAARTGEPWTSRLKTSHAVVTAQVTRYVAVSILFDTLCHATMWAYWNF